jgi:hypothetical protein
MVAKRCFASWVMSSEKADVPGVVRRGILFNGVNYVEDSLRSVCFGACLTRGERRFFAQQKGGSVISMGNHFALLHLEGAKCWKCRKMLMIRGLLKA